MSGCGVVKASWVRKQSPMNGVYCCLIGNSLKNDREKETYVFLSSDPIYTTILHNRRLTSVKETRSVAPFWHLVLVVGPVFPYTRALECAQRWVNLTRGCKSKIRHGIILAAEYRVACLANHVQVPGGTRRYLQKHGTRKYVRAYRRLAVRRTEGGKLK